MKQVAGWIDEAIQGRADGDELATLHSTVKEFASGYPLNPTV